METTRRLLALLVLARLSLLSRSQGTLNAVQFLANTAALSVTYDNIMKAKLNFALEGVGPYTIFAPTNKAWDKLGPGVLTSLIMPDNANFLGQVLQYHLAYGDTKSEMMIRDQEIQTVEGSKVQITNVNPFRVNGAKASSPDIVVSNGIGHILEEVLLPKGFKFPPTSKTVGELTLTTDYLSIWAQGTQLSGLKDTLAGPGTYTAFVPNDAAFADLGLGIAESLLMEANRKKLQQVLAFHVASGIKETSGMTAGQVFNSLEGGFLTVTQITPSVQMNVVAQFISPDVPAVNGIVHIIDQVMLPIDFQYPDKNLLELAQAESSLSILTDAIRAADFSQILSGREQYTIFAPTNAAFEALGMGMATSLLLPAYKFKLRQVLKYHISQGAFTTENFPQFGAVKTLEKGSLEISSISPLVVNGVATAKMKNVPVRNGIVHVMDAVMLPPVFKFPDKTVMQLATHTGDLSTFKAAVNRAGLQEALSAEGPFTVFTPTDDAFLALGPENLEALLTPAKKQDLIRLLRYHIIHGKSDSAKLTHGREIETLEGSAIVVTPWTELGWKGIAYESFSPEITLNNDCKVTTSNALVTNGIVHIVNKVLLPPGFEMPFNEEDTRWKATTSSSRRQRPAVALMAWLLGGFGCACFS
eukprot:TRINITY_DN10774_c0_g1_i2.p1 TRINITY_DN10774_c0_g1~~TRINITY_DN10774_c0_g1_i2.p1  ORF type:complete len:643 (+),score=148.45 TRINITY_DN10774_c0_g1_i2:45-1973(+)